MTNAEITIMGLLWEQPNHAYQIEQVLKDKGLKNKVKLAFSSIYSILKKLEKKNLLEFYIQKTDKLPDKKIFSLTEEGKKILLQEFRKSLTYPRTEKSSFELCLHFSKFMDKQELKEILKVYEAELTRLIQNQVYEITHLKTTDPVERALYNRSLKLWQADKQWLKELLIMI